ncbi:MAG: hypothetical protein BEU04_04975 [Marine Group III euryarchaeote CG-Bathy1]|uniref:Nudix hydrolase domain-containing protein n=1 Tax=Marine Group III euryarchaeote CG-Bathy1 TaxID=1889001 RepID=A0A1J5T5I7_9ARCH|nr:MAG: hypothetical protein BEU04_04975 [Marine Group III euryarchaeote CG-Bathy1]
MIQKLQKKLEGKLPGIESWKRMAVKSGKGESIESESLQKYSDWISKDKLNDMRKAAVLIGLFKKNDEWCFSLIRRPMNEKNHPGQIALPGGAREKNENLMNTALREAFEEVGIKPEDVQIIGQLTPIPVPVSEYLIYPFVGVIDYEPEWVINEDEVEELFILRMSELISSDNGYTETWDLRGNKVEVPIFKVMNETVWGATAAVLSELIDIAK